MEEIKMSEKEKEMLYNASMSYGDRLSSQSKEIRETFLAKQISDKAKEYYALAQKIVTTK